MCGLPKDEVSSRYVLCRLIQMEDSDTATYAYTALQPQRARCRFLASSPSSSLFSTPRQVHRTVRLCALAHIAFCSASQTSLHRFKWIRGGRRYIDSSRRSVEVRKSARPRALCSWLPFLHITLPLTHTPFSTLHSYSPSTMSKYLEPNPFEE